MQSSSSSLNGNISIMTEGKRQAESKITFFITTSFFLGYTLVSVKRTVFLAPCVFYFKRNLDISRDGKQLFVTQICLLSFLSCHHDHQERTDHSRFDGIFTTSALRL